MLRLAAVLVPLAVLACTPPRAPVDEPARDAGGDELPDAGDDPRDGEEGAGTDAGDPDAGARDPDDAGPDPFVDAGPAERTVASCFSDIGSETGASPDYDQFHPIVGSHCMGTNFQDIHDVERVVFLGDSVTVGTPPTSASEFYRSRLADMLAQRFGLEPPSAVWKSANPLEGTASVRHSGAFWSCAKWGARTDDGDIARFRVNVFVDKGGVSAVMRQIPAKILTFEQLNLPPVVARLCDNPKGLVLVTGPTGSGKSTTLAAMIDYINKTRAQHIITLEDPIEFVHKSEMCLVNQREVYAHTRSFARALKAALREDPDIVLVGEMRDLETIQLALETANTGHLVFGTLHTSTAISTVDRIIDVFPPAQQSQVRAVLADTLKGVVAQALCKKVGGGRVAALETLVLSYAVANLIREGKTHQIASAMTTSKAQGNTLLNESLAQLVNEGRVEYAEALSKALDKADFARRCGKPAPGAAPT
jgi:pilus retraction protein PilT